MPRLTLLQLPPRCASLSSDWPENMDPCLSTTVKGLDILLGHKPACHSFTDATPEPGLETKNFVTAVASTSWFHWLSPETQWQAQISSVTQSRLAFQLPSPRLGNTNTLSMAIKQTCLPFSPELKTVFMIFDSK